MIYPRRIFSLFYFLFTSYSVIAVNRVPIKIVQEPATYGNLFVQSQAGSAAGTLKIKSQPSLYSGPPHLRYLSDICFNLTDNKYRYLFCPFNNLTQHELTYRWNAYQGVLGVWQQWEIANNTFKSMKYADGDSCGQSNREVQVHFECGPNNMLKNVTEPSRCQYEGIFESQDVCSDDSLLVYPSLSLEMQREWDQLEWQLSTGEITEKGYNQLLSDIFVKSGFQKKLKTNMSISKEPSGSESPASPVSPISLNTGTAIDEAGHFSRLDHCNEAYDDLKKELEKVTEELAALKILNEISIKQSN